MSVIIMALVGSLIDMALNTMEAIMTAIYKHNHNKRVFVNGRWNPAKE